MNKTLVSSWQHNGYMYTLTAEPIAKTESKQLLTESNNDDEVEYVSLYHYLGHSNRDSGKGLEVYNEAKAHGIKVISEDNPKSPNGKVLKYPRAFLNEYFKPEAIDYRAKLKTIPDVTDSTIDVDDLPF